MSTPTAERVNFIGFDGSVPKWLILWQRKGRAVSKTLCYTDMELDEQLQFHSHQFDSYVVLGVEMPAKRKEMKEVKVSANEINQKLQHFRGNLARIQIHSPEDLRRLAIKVNAFSEELWEQVDEMDRKEEEEMKHDQ